MPDLRGLVNRRSSMIVVVGRYHTIPLEMSIGIVYGPPMDSPVCGIAWKTCTRERWDPDQTVLPQSEKVELKPLYVCPECSLHTYSNNMI
jgi:hypothetical protein